MNNKELIPGADNVIMISAEFLEAGYMLKSGRADLHRYELDLYVRSDITCEQLLGAIYAGLRDVLTKCYQLDVQKDLTGAIYNDRLPYLEEGANDRQREKPRLRSLLLEGYRWRSASARQNEMHIKLAQLDRRRPVGQDDDLSQTPQEREIQGWLVCWQVYLECYHAYHEGYPEVRKISSDEFRSHPVIALGGVPLPRMAAHEMLTSAAAPLIFLQQDIHGTMTLQEMGFSDGCRLIFDPVQWLRTAPEFRMAALQQEASVFGVDAAIQASAFHDRQPFLIKSPNLPPLGQEGGLLPLVLPPLITTGTALSLWTLSGVDAQPGQTLLFSGIMLASSCAGSLINRMVQKKNSSSAIRKWRKAYEQYIRHCLAEIQNRQQQDTAMLVQAYPAAWNDSARDLVSSILRSSPRMYSRSPQEEDFLCARVGLSSEGSKLVPSLFSITGDIDSNVYTGVRYRNLGSRSAPFQLQLPDGSAEEHMPDPRSGDLSELPGAIAELFGHLNHAPVLLDLKADTVLGLVTPPPVQAVPFLSNLLLDLCFHHAPDHLQVVMLCNETNDWKARQDQIRRYKYLPHFRELMPDRSQFAFQKKEAWIIFDLLQALIRRRRQSGEHTPHILVILREDYDIDSHSLIRMLRDGNPYSGSDGITLLFCKHSRSELPAYCGSMILANDTAQWYKLPHAYGSEGASQASRGWYAFSPDAMPSGNPASRNGPAEELLNHAFRMLGARHDPSADHAAIPSYVEMFRILKQGDTGKTMADAADAASRETDHAYLRHLKQALEALVHSSWSTADASDLAVCIGRDAAGDVLLDLREAADGTHMLIAGDRGTGKTEAAACYLLALCSRFSPQQVQLQLLDVGGSGVFRLLEKLPHGEAMLSEPVGTAWQMGERMHEILRRLDAEIAARKLRLKQLGCTDIGAYNQKLRQSAMDRSSAPSHRSMPHLFVVIEDYDDLTDIASGEEGAWDAALTSLIERSTGLGIHLILLTSQTEHCCSDQLLDRIPVRLCLKVSDPVTSERLLLSDAAAAGGIPERGRAYLRRGGESGFTCLQLGYAGADVAGCRYAPFQVAMLPAGGSSVPFFVSDRYEPHDEDDGILIHTVYHPQKADIGTIHRRSAPERSTVEQARPQRSDLRPATPGTPIQGDLRPAIPGTAMQGDFRPMTPDPAMQGDLRPATPGTPIQGENIISGASDPRRRKEDANRYFRSPLDSKEIRQLKIPHPDAVLRRRRPIGISQGEFLVKVLRECAASQNLGHK